MPILVAVASSVLVVASHLASAAPQESAPAPRIRLQRLFEAERWVRPTQVLQRPDSNDELHVLEQGGVIKVARLSQPDGGAAVFMDISDRVNFGSNEEGLLSMAFHPRFAENRQFLVYYSAKDPRRSVLSRFKAVPGPEGGQSLVGDPSSEEVILAVEQPFWNHNGGTVLFGPDGMVYLSLGDGGAANDPLRAGQDFGTLLAKIVRIDVDRRDGDRRYAIPADNPFVDRSGARPEIWALGLRNVWRMSFDRATGELWAGDVGQNRWEEINRVVRGGNYGWNLREGRHPFARGEAEGELLDPVVEYPRDQGISVTGGHVYRGTAIPGLAGSYVYADYAYGNIWALPVDDPSAGPALLLKARSGSRGLLVSSFGEGNGGELYLTAFEGGERGPGAVFAVVGSGTTQ